MTNERLKPIGLVLAVLVAFPGGIGCSPYIDPNVPEPIRPFVEPEFGGEYLLYRPSSYDRTRGWALIVICHGSFPDSPNRQLRTWTQLAEEKGFLLLAPSLESVKGLWKLSAKKRIVLLRSDEKHIIACVRHVRAGHNISDDRILLHGYSEGALPALSAGLEHPDLFRVVVLTQPKFDGDLLTEAGENVDPYQPVFVNYDVGDALTGRNAARCLEWLRSHGVNLTEDPTGPGHRFNPDTTANRSAVVFFERILRVEPWIRIRAFPAPGGELRELQFKLRCSFEPKRYLWDFGDGETSPVAAPAHTYAQPGPYTVTLTVEGTRSKHHTRRKIIHVP